MHVATLMDEEPVNKMLAKDAQTIKEVSERDIIGEEDSQDLSSSIAGSSINAAR